jgi:hypothetical protein
MDIKFQGTIQLIDGQNTSTFYLPDKGLSYGKTNLNTKDLARRIFLPSTEVQTIEFGTTDSGVFLGIVTDNEIQIDITGVITGLVIKADRIINTDKKFGFFLTTIDDMTTPLVLTGLTLDANVDIYIVSHNV